jgi:hypothetical protein
MTHTKALYWADCHILSIVMLTVILLNVIMLFIEIIQFNYAYYVLYGRLPL